MCMIKWMIAGFHHIPLKHFAVAMPAQFIMRLAPGYARGGPPGRSSGGRVYKHPEFLKCPRLVRPGVNITSCEYNMHHKHHKPSRHAIANWCSPKKTPIKRQSKQKFNRPTASL